MPYSYIVLIIELCLSGGPYQRFRAGPGGSCLSVPDADLENFGFWV